MERRAGGVIHEAYDEQGPYRGAGHPDLWEKLKKDSPDIMSIIKLSYKLSYKLRMQWVAHCCGLNRIKQFLHGMARILAKLLMRRFPTLIAAPSASTAERKM